MFTHVRPTGCAGHGREGEGSHPQIENCRISFSICEPLRNLRAVRGISMVAGELSDFGLVKLVTDCLVLVNGFNGRSVRLVPDKACADAYRAQFVDERNRRAAIPLALLRTESVCRIRHAYQSRTRECHRPIELPSPGSDHPPGQTRTARLS